jgi:hypothetical protein
VLAVPIGERGNILGLIEVFSCAAYAFRENHCSALQELAKTVALSLRPEAVAGTPAAAPADSRREKATATPASAGTEAASAAVSSAPSPTAPATPVISSAPEPGEVKSDRGGERLILAALIAVLVILGLWLLLERGPDGTKNVDAAEAPPAETQSAPQPAPAAPRNLGLARSASADAPDSLYELRQRAQAGDAEAEFEMGARYASGEDVAQDYPQAVKWFTVAADRGQVLAAATLGAYYWAGRGVPQDDVSAYMWSAIAKQGGDEASKYRLTILRARMSMAQISEAEQRAAAWRQTHFPAHLEGKNTTQP